MIASWALGGLYLSLGPSVTAGLFGLHQPSDRRAGRDAAVRHGRVTAFVLRSRPAPSLLAPASVLLGLGTLVTLAGVVVGPGRRSPPSAP